jgi:hypothetical protein
LEIDALTADCKFNGQAVEQLSIAWELHRWLLDDLAGQGLPVGSIQSARLQARLELTEIPPQARATNAMHLASDGKLATAATLHRCAILCHSDLTTDEGTYSASFQDVEEWPVGWPGP